MSAGAKRCFGDGCKGGGGRVRDRSVGRVGEIVRDGPWRHARQSQLQAAQGHGPLNAVQVTWS